MSQATIMGEVRSLGHDARVRRNRDMAAPVLGSNHGGEQHGGVALHRRELEHTHAGEPHGVDEPHGDQVAPQQQVQPHDVALSRRGGAANRGRVGL